MLEHGLIAGWVTLCWHSQRRVSNSLQAGQVNISIKNPALPSQCRFCTHLRVCSSGVSYASCGKCVCWSFRLAFKTSSPETYIYAMKSKSVGRTAGPSVAQTEPPPDRPQALNGKCQLLIAVATLGITFIANHCLSSSEYFLLAV